MTTVVEHLAELTGFRDRDLLDVTLVGAMRDLLRPREVAIYRAVGDGGRRRWHTRARLRPGDVAAIADPLWAEPETLPPLHAHPQRQRCLLRNQTIIGAGRPAWSYFPLDAERETVGVLEVCSEQPMTTETVRLVSSVLRIYRNFHALLDDSERDPLTRLLNRKPFDACFLRAAAAGSLAASDDASDAEADTDADIPGAAPGAPPARRHAAPATAWLGVVDIDHFKRVNDTFGHLIGDEVLLLLSRLMRSSFRFHDHLFRFGGEEFVVLMRCPGAAAAATVFERMRANVEQYEFPQVGRITVSLGYTQLRPGDTPSGAFERADKAVYWAKQHGRNQVCDQAELVARGELRDEARGNHVELF